jgi:hypothetical protein
MRQGWLSLDQLGVIAAGAGPGSDAHYEQLARVATVNQLRTAVRLEPRPDPEPAPAPHASITSTAGAGFTRWRITLPAVEAATFQAALDCHREALVSEWTRDRDTGSPAPEAAAPMPGTVEAFLRSKQVKFTRSDVDDGRLTVRFPGVAEQLLARDAVNEGLSATYVSALTRASRAPEFFRTLGLRPMALGLDLRGGLYLLYQVDVKGAVSQLLDSYLYEYLHRRRTFQTF